jgi:hypothetical protein
LLGVKKKEQLLDEVEVLSGKPLRRFRRSVVQRGFGQRNRVNYGMTIRV